MSCWLLVGGCVVSVAVWFLFCRPKKITIHQLYVYPVKSCKGIAVSSWKIGSKGFLYDRQWMIVRENGVFITQRQSPKMCLIETKLSGPQDNLSLSLTAPGMPEIHVGDGSNHSERKVVEFFQTKVEGVDMGEEIAKWLTEYLGFASRLVMTPPDFQRDLDETYVAQLRNNKETKLNVGYADGFPFLLTNVASLKWLNTHLVSNQSDPHEKIELDMQRFRPNIVVSGIDPFKEDEWKTIEITSNHKSSVILHLVKPCSRCTIPNVDWKTGKRAEEPLKTLRELRMQKLPFAAPGSTETYPMFGQNCVAQLPEGTLRVGDEISVLH